MFGQTPYYLADAHSKSCNSPATRYGHTLQSISDHCILRETPLAKVCCLFDNLLGILKLASRFTVENELDDNTFHMGLALRRFEYVLALLVACGEPDGSRLNRYNDALCQACRHQGDPPPARRDRSFHDTISASRRRQVFDSLPAASCRGLSCYVVLVHLLVHTTP